jgi:ribosomal protein L35
MLKMPKMKTKKAVQKRIHITKGGKGKLQVGSVGIQHGKTRLSRRTIRRKKGLSNLSSGKVKIVKRFLPYGGKK